MKKVAIVSQSIDLYRSSQVTIFAAQEASREGWDVSVVLPGDGPLSEKLRNMNVDVVYAEVPSLRRALLRSRPIPELMYIARAMRSFRKLAVVRGASVIHVVCSTNLAAYSLTRATRRKKVVWSIHEDLSSTWLGRGLAHIVSFAGARTVACASSYVRDCLPKRLRLRARVIHSGTSIPASSPGKFEWPFIEIDGVTKIACVGRLNAWKGQDILVESIATLRDRGVRSQVAIVGDVFPGDHDWRSEIETSIERHGLRDQVILTGHIESAWRAFTAADIAVVPSKRPEPFGKVVIEAMLLGRPVVATRAGGPIEVITDGEDGYLAEMGDASDMADTLLRVIEARAQWSEIGLRAQERGKEFSAHRCGVAYEKAYSEAAREGR